MPERETSKERLLHAAVDYVAEHGVAELSLRALAAAIGTSHRMLIYYFGSKETLLLEVIRAVEDEQRRLLAELDVDPTLGPFEVGRRMWHHLADPALWPSERLFFETYAQALQGRPHTADFLDDVVESWLGPTTALRIEHGVPPERARAQARLDLAVTRGLLLDLLATRDRAGADDAMEQYIALFESWSASRPDGRRVTTGDDDMAPAATAASAPPALSATRPVRLLFVSGSLRRSSTNTAVLRTARDLAPDLVTPVLYERLGELPAFNPDDDVVPLPPPVADLRAQIRRADGLLFSVPEYAGGLPGSLKNLLDWCIGDDQPGSIYEKPVAWINASIRDAADAHRSLRTVLGYANASVVEAACAHIPVSTAVVDDDGLIGDAAVRDAVGRSLGQLAAFAAAVT